MFDIITIGSATRDVFLKTGSFEVRQHADSPTGLEQCLALGAKIEIKELVMATGGGGSNTAVTFARQGLKTACLGVVGEDAIGAEILQELKREKVAVNFFQKHRDNQSAYSVILVNSSGERTILSYKGEGQHLLTEKVAWRELQAPWFYLDSLGGNFEFLDTTFSHLKKIKARTAFNPGGKELTHGLEKLSPFLREVDVLITNREEGAQLTGVDFQDFDLVLDRLAALVRGLVIVSDGPAGVRVREGRQKEYRAGIPASPVVERTGAGDAFGSGFTAEYLRSGNVAKAMQLGTANASAVVAQFGAKAGILKKGDNGPWPLVPVEMVILNS